jgi:hypothetical protein
VGAANGVMELLSVKVWVPAHAAKVTYDATGAKETPPAVANDSEGKPQPWLYTRFARVQALSGDLLVRKLKVGDANPTMNTGDYRVFQSTAEIFQLAYNETVWVAAAAGTADGAVVWGQ